MKNITLYLISFLGSCMVSSGIVLDLDVRDENNMPVAGALASLVFQSYLRNHDVEKDQLTNASGQATISGTPTDEKPMVTLDIKVSKDGYYDSRMEITDFQEGKIGAMIRLRKQVQPIALYVKNACAALPDQMKWFGYDLLVGDLVEPYGLGKTADFQLKVESMPTIPDQAGVPEGLEAGFWIQFNDPAEGLQFEKNRYWKESEMKMPGMAPESGYQQSYLRREKSYHNAQYDYAAGIFLRTRVKRDAHGQITSSHYTKFLADLRFDPRISGWHVDDKGKPVTHGTICFTYYFNPTPNDRNLEFDPKRNLFRENGYTQPYFTP